eukprot:TRINITY_DN3063_c0_g1_i1.p1 TRINITY_DN3063_c0_g1~~TRINITY_DN3063_c0_g1_i1.p1  ORF type:complete len:203 (-),score=29.26 TRINITY_DN3063_c0_g1_i1:54-662(-)
MDGALTMRQEPSEVLSVDVHPSRGLIFPSLVDLTFDHHPQDVLTVLGHPDYVSYKTDDPLVIHSNKYMNEYQYDYFYNYFDLGIDILFSAVTHRIKKFVLHTNFPTNEKFNVYRKCNYQIIPALSDYDESSEEESLFRPITPEMKWIEILEIFNSDPIDEFISPPENSPFGGTSYYAFKDIIFEVMGNGYINTVTLFNNTSD